MNIAIIQVRMGSSRLPGKAMIRFHGLPAWWWVAARAMQSGMIDKVVIATTPGEEDLELIESVAGSMLPGKRRPSVFVGSKDDVLERYWRAARCFCTNQDTVIRLTGDCPVIDPRLITQSISYYNNLRYKKIDYVATRHDPDAYPDGMDVEVFSHEALTVAWTNAVTPLDREHVTLWIKRNMRVANLPSEGKMGHIRCTLDTWEDFETIKRLFMKYHDKDRWFGLSEVLEDHAEMSAGGGK